MFVADSVGVQRFSQRFPVELRITLRTRQRSHIGQQLDFVLFQQRNEVVDAAGRVANRPDFHDLRQTTVRTSRQVARVSGLLGSTGCQPVGLGSLPRWAFLNLVRESGCERMLPAGLPATTGWQPVLPSISDTALADVNAPVSAKPQLRPWTSTFDQGRCWLRSLRLCLFQTRHASRRGCEETNRTPAHRED